MAHQGLSLACAASLAALGCGPAANPPPRPAPGPLELARPPSLDGGPWGEFRSARFELRLPLPDGRAWRIDDRSTPWLSATHPATSSTVLVRRWHEDELMNREKCERRAREFRALPAREGSELMETRPVPVPAEFDTRVEVRFVPAAARQTLRGFALAFGGWAHGCFAFVFTTSASGPGAEEVIGDRLALVVEGSLTALTVESPLRPGDHGRVVPTLPEVERGPARLP